MDEVKNNPISSIVDGIIILNSRETAGEEQRYIQIHKMRGTQHDRNRHAMTIRRDSISDTNGGETQRMKIGIKGVDQLLGAGIPWGSSLLVSGTAGIGKTLFLLETIYRGAKESGEKGLFFSFEETPERLLASAQTMGWDLQEQISKGRIEIIFIPQTEILVEANIQMIFDILFHMIDHSSVIREKVFLLATIVQRSHAIGFFSSDIPFGSNQVSRFGVEEALVDEVILLSNEIGSDIPKRHLEVYKLRNTDHTPGRHDVSIQKGGFQISQK